jgi:hypothetical protein
VAQADEAFKKSIDTLKEGLKAGTNPIKAIRRATRQYGALLGGRPTQEQAMAFVSALEAIANEQPDKERAKAVANEASRLIDADFRSADFTVPTTTGDVGVYIRDPALWAHLKKDPKNYQAVTSAAQGLADIQRLEDGLRSLSLTPDLPLLRHIPLDERGNMTLDALFNGDAVRDKQTIDQLAKILTKQAHIRDQEAVRNAMNLMWEKMEAQGIAGTTMTLTQFATEALSNYAPDIRIGRLGQSPKRIVQHAEKVSQSMGLYFDFGQ